MKRVVYILAGAIIAAAAVMGMTPEERRSFEAFEQQVKSGNPQAQMRMAMLLENGYDSIPADTIRAISLLRQAANADFPPAMNYLGFLYREGRYITADPDSAEYWIRRASDAGDPNAAANLAYLILEHDSHTDSLAANQSYADCQTDTEAAGLLRRAADAGVTPAMLRLSSLYAEGRGVPRDSVEATTLAMQAARSLFAGRDPRTAVLLAEKIVADSTRTDAHSLRLRGEAWKLLGDAYSTGRGADYNHDASLSAYYRAAQLGDSIATRFISETLELFPDALR